MNPEISRQDSSRTEILCRCGVRLQYDHPDLVRACPHCGAKLPAREAVLAPTVSIARPDPGGENTVLEHVPASRPAPSAPTRLGHYEVLEFAGEGGMGRVYRAYDSSLDRVVAVKVLAESFRETPLVVSRFFNEARAAARIQHPNVVSIHYVGMEGDCPFFAMEYLGEKSVADLVDLYGALPHDRALDIVIQAARGLEAAHERGVIHRDVKPSNLLIDRENVVKVVDFGLAKNFRLSSDITSEGTLLGTPAYMSPEQARGEATDSRSDIYSLGVAFYELLAGRRPFQIKTPIRLLAAKLEQEPPALGGLAPSCPPRTIRVVEKMLAKDPARRYPDYRNLLGDLEACRSRPRVRAGLWPRGWALLVDVLVIYGLFVLLLQAWHLVGRTRQAEEALARFLDRSSVLGIALGLERTPEEIGQGLEVVIAILVVGYFGICHWRWGATLGKQITHVEVLDRWGDRPSLVRSFARAGLVWLLYFLDLDHLLETRIGLAYLAAIWVVASAVLVGRRRLALHDNLTGTEVVYR